MDNSLIIIAISTILILITIIIKRKYDYFKDRGIPHLKPYWPLGNFWKVGLSVHFINRVNEIYRRCKGSAKICGFYIFTIPVYIILDVEIIKNILVKDFDSFHDRGNAKRSFMYYLLVIHRALTY